MSDICKHAMHLGLIAQAVDNMPALVVHRISDTNCGHISDDDHEAVWAVTLPARNSLRQVRLCDRHFALFILDREQFEQLTIPLGGEE